MVLERAAARLQRVGGAYALSIRNPKELDRLVPNWERFCTEFAPVAPGSLLAQDAVRQLGRRLFEQLTGARCATLLHGDLKAMNCFLPVCDGARATLIDFASAGVGFGMSDVAMLLSHSVAPELLRDGGEERLLDVNLKALSVPYPRDQALRHYRLGLCDYARFVVARFWTDTSLAGFANRASNPNTTLVNRSAEAALCFVERVHNSLAQLEAE